MILMICFEDKKLWKIRLLYENTQERRRKKKETRENIHWETMIAAVLVRSLNGPPNP